MRKPRGLVIVTGGTKGLGRSISLRFGREGFEVMALFRSDTDAAAALELEFRKEGILGRCVLCDVARSSFELPELPDGMEIVLIHCAAAPFTPGPMHLLDPSDYVRQFETAVLGCIRSVQAVLKPMVRMKRGTIITILSSAIRENPCPKGFSAYVAAKTALAGLTGALASEYHARGVRVFSVSPGFMATSLTDPWDERLRNAILEGQGQAISPDEVADFIWMKYSDPLRVKAWVDYLFPEGDALR